MLGTKCLSEMGEDALLAFADECAETARDAEIGLIRVAYQWAITHPADRLDPAEAEKPGRERARQLGGAGTPLVCEFAAADLGARIGLSAYAAAQLMADALDLYQRHERLRARVEAGEVRVSYARHVCAKTRDLTAEQAAYVDSAVAEFADGRLPWTRFANLVEAKVAQAAPEAARLKEERASRATFAKKLRTEAHGMGTFMVRADIATIDQIDAAVTAREATLVEAMPDATSDERRVGAVLLMANPGSTPETPTPELLPAVTLFLHSYVVRMPSRWRGSRDTGRSRRRGSLASSALGRSSRSSPSSTSPARHPWMATRSPTDIDRPCIC